MNPYTHAISEARLSSGDMDVRGALWAYLKAQEAAYDTGYTAAAGNPFDYVITQAEQLLGDSWALTRIKQTFGCMSVYHK